MKKLISKLAALFAMAMFATLLLSSNKAAAQSFESVDFFAGQNIPAGNVTIFNDDQFIYVIYTMNPGWVITQTHMDYASSDTGIPQKNGNPTLGQFSFKDSFPNGTSFVSYAIPLLSVTSQDLVIAAHGAVAQVDSNGKVIQTQTAWGDGLPFSGKNWATYIPFSLSFGV